MNDLDRLLHDALHDERRALPVPADTLTAVRRRRNRRRTGVAALSTAAAVGVLATGAALAQGSSGKGTADRLTQGPPVATGCATAPRGQLEGSDYVVRTARDWFMTKAQSDAFFRTFNQPSPKPQDTVPSPQPSGPGTDRLVAALTAAGVPGADSLKRDEADSGQRGSLSVQGTLPNGHDLAVYRSPSLFPFTTSGYYGSDTEDSSRDVVIEDVPGTDCAALLLASHVSGSPSSALVQVVTPDGLSTGWSSATVPLAQLKQWAYATAAWETTHP